MIKREIIEKIKPWLGKEKILILKGARQVGKTHLLHELKNHLELKGRKVVYLLADNIDNQPVLQSLASLELYLEQRHKFPRDYLYLMIDELQVLNEAGILLKNIFDKHKSRLQIIVSGSSTLEINKNSEYLTGRAIHFNVARVNFREYYNFSEGLEMKGYDLPEWDKLNIFWQTFRPILERRLEEFLSFGSYPEVLVTKDRRDKEIVLHSIIKTYIDKDIISQLKVGNVTGFNKLIKILASQIDQLVNVNELANTTNISINTLKKYLDILVGTHIIDLVSPYFKNIRTEISKMPKVYLLDNGIRNYLLRSFDVNLEGQGSVLENFVYNYFLTQYEKEYVHFYRTNTGSEIDFVIEDINNTLTLCEVKYRNRVTVPVIMKNFGKKYSNIDKKIIITKDILKKDGDIYFVPVALLPFINLTKIV